MTPAPSAQFVGFLAAFLASLAGSQPSQALRNVKVGDQVPAFEVVDLTGKAINKTSYQGKTLLLIFVRPEQEKSLAALRTVQRVLKSNAELAVLAVSSKPDAADHFRKVVADNAFTFPVASDPGRKTYGTFGVIVTPTTLLIDGAGVLRYQLSHLPVNYERRLRIHVDHLSGRINTEEHDALLARMAEGKTEVGDRSAPRLRLARVLVDQGKFAEAIPVLQKLKSEKDSATIAALLGMAHLGLDRVDEAAKHLDPLAEIQPAPPTLKRALARLEIRRGNDAKAEAHLAAAREASPRDIAVLYELGRLYEGQGELAKAVECYRAALDEVRGRHR